MFTVIALDEKETNVDENVEKNAINSHDDHVEKTNESFAIIKAGGKQLKVVENDTIFIEKIDGDVNQEVNFEVLLVNNQIGRPLVPGAKVVGIIQKQGKQKKIVVYRHNAKSTHKRKYGHRQPYTRVLITKIIEEAGTDHVKG